MIQPRGIAITIEIRTGKRNSLASVYITVIESAPITFLIPISFVLRSVENDDKPYNPRQAIIIARIVKYFNRSVIRI